MIGLLQQIVDMFVCWVETGVTLVVNAVIAGLGAVVGAVLLLLPNMPDQPTVPTALTTAASWVAWVFPVGTAVEVFAFVLGAWLVWLIVSIALRWAKALGA